jgi:hypothetical protein
MFMQPQTTTIVELWTFGETIRTGGDLSGYHVEATDGSIGKIDEATYDAGSSLLVIDTGPWIFGKKVMIPAGLVESVDHDEQQVFVRGTKDEIKAAPEYSDGLFKDDAYRKELGTYYGGLIGLTDDRSPTF